MQSRKFVQTMTAGDLNVDSSPDPTWENSPSINLQNNQSVSFGPGNKDFLSSIASSPNKKQGTPVYSNNQNHHSGKELNLFQMMSDQNYEEQFSLRLSNEPSLPVGQQYNNSTPQAKSGVPDSSPQDLMNNVGGLQTAEMSQAIFEFAQNTQKQKQQAQSAQKEPSSPIKIGDRKQFLNKTQAGVKQSQLKSTNKPIQPFMATMFPVSAKEQFIDQKLTLQKGKTVTRSQQNLVSSQSNTASKQNHHQSSPNSLQQQQSCISSSTYGKMFPKNNNNQNRVSITKRRNSGGGSYYLTNSPKKQPEQQNQTDELGPFQVAQDAEQKQENDDYEQSQQQFGSHLKLFFERKTLEQSAQQRKEQNEVQQNDQNRGNRISVNDRFSQNLGSKHQQNQNNQESLKNLHHSESRSKRLGLEYQSSNKALHGEKHSFVSQERLTRSSKKMEVIRHNSPKNNDRFALASQNSIIGAVHSNKLHERVIWFYKRLCEEYDCPILPQFLQETIITAFKTSKFQKNLNKGDDYGSRSPKMLKSSFLESSNNKSQLKNNKNSSGVVQINTSMLSDKSVQAVCDSLRRFQQKIKVVELYHNQEFKGANSTSGKGSPQRAGFTRISSPSRAFAALPWSFPRPAHLIMLLKSLTKTSTLKIICDTDCAQFITEPHYQALVNALGRNPPKLEDQNNITDENQNQKKNNHTSKALLSTIDIQGFHAKPSFFKNLVINITAAKMLNIHTLSLTNCAIQDAEGQELCKAIIHGRQTPLLRTFNLQKNLLGFKFGSSLIATLIDAQTVAQEETMKAVQKNQAQETSNGSNTGANSNNMIKFESLDHFSVEKIDLEYNKLSFLVIQTVEKLIKNLHQFKEQAKLHQNMFQMQTGRSPQQGSSLTQQITAQTLGGFSSNLNYQPNSQVIIEQTEESSLSSETSCQDSIDDKHLVDLFEEFIGYNKRSTSKKHQQFRSPGRFRSRSGRRKSASRTPDAFRAKRKSAQLTGTPNNFKDASVMKSYNQTKDHTRGEALETESAHSKAAIFDAAEMTTILSINHSNRSSRALQLKHFSQAISNITTRSTAKKIISSATKMTATPNQKPSLKSLSPRAKHPSAMTIIPVSQLFNDDENETLESDNKDTIRNKDQSSNTNDLPQVISVAQFLDEKQLSSQSQSQLKPQVTRTAKHAQQVQSYSSPVHGQKKQQNLQQHNQQQLKVPSKVDSGLNSFQSQRTGNRKLKSQISPNRLELTTPQKPAGTIAMKEKMEYTVAEIGTFMDPDSIKARTNVQIFTKASREKVGVGALKKKKGRSKIEGFFKSDVASNFNSSVVKDSQTRNKFAGNTGSLASKNYLALHHHEESSQPQHKLIQSQSRDCGLEISKGQIPFQQTAINMQQLSKPGQHTQNTPMRRQERLQQSSRSSKTFLQASKTGASSSIPYMMTETQIRKSPRGNFQRHSNPQLTIKKPIMTLKSAAKAATQAQKVQNKNNNQGIGRPKVLIDLGQEVLYDSEILQTDATDLSQLPILVQKSQPGPKIIRQNYMRDQSPYKAPPKPLALTKSVSANGDQFIIDNVVETESPPEFAPVQKIMNQPGPTMRPNDLLTPPIAGQKKHTKCELQRSKARADLNSSEEDPCSDPYFASLQCYSAERVQDGRMVKSYLNSVLQSANNSQNSSPDPRYRSMHNLGNAPHSHRQKNVSIYSTGGGGGLSTSNLHKINKNSFVSVNDQMQNLEKGSRTLQISKQTDYNNMGSQHNLNLQQSVSDVIVFDYQADGSSHQKQPVSKRCAESLSSQVLYSKQSVEIDESFTAKSTNMIQQRVLFGPAFQTADDNDEYNDDVCQEIDSAEILSPVREDDSSLGLETPAKELNPKGTTRMRSSFSQRQQLALIAQPFSAPATHTNASVEIQANNSDGDMDGEDEDAIMPTEQIEPNGSDIECRVTRYTFGKQGERKTLKSQKLASELIYQSRGGKSNNMHADSRSRFERNKMQGVSNSYIITGNMMK